MRKQTKIAAVASAAALLAIGASMTAFAAGWRENTDGTWTYEDADGEAVEGWKTWNHDGQRYYIDPDTGLMAASTIKEVDSGEYYYFHSNGAMAKNEWIELDSSDVVEMLDLDEDELYDPNAPESYYFYADKTGKIVTGDGASLSAKAIPVETGSSKTSKFVFDEYGRMLTGWINTDGNYMYCYPEKTDKYVFGQPVVKGWVNLLEVDLEADEDLEDLVYGDHSEDDEVWFYFGGDGKTVVDGLDDSKSYYLGDDGVMWQDDLVEYDGALYYATSNGSFAKSQWRNLDDKVYYYFDNKGKSVGYRVGDAKDITVYYQDKVYYFFGKDGKLLVDTLVTAGKRDDTTGDVTVTVGKDSVTLTTNNAKKNTVGKVAGNTYYFDEGGNLVKGAQFEYGGYTGYVDEDGNVITDAIAIINKAVYANNADTGFAVLQEQDDYEYGYVKVGETGVVSYSKKGKDNGTNKDYKNGDYIVVNEDGTLATRKEDIVADGAEKLIPFDTTDANGVGKKAEQTPAE